MKDVEYLQEIISYNPITGLCFWKSRPRTDFRYAKDHTKWNKKYVGTQITTTNPSTGKIICRLNQKTYSLDQLIYLMTTGEQHKTIHHTNGCNADNTWDNLSSTSPGIRPTKYEGGDLLLTQNEHGIYLVKSHNHIFNFYFDKREAKTALYELADRFQTGFQCQT